MPSRSTRNQVSLRRPGTASILMPKDGTANEWMTSAPMTCMRTTVPTGTTMLVVDGEQARAGVRLGRALVLGQHQRVERDVAVVGILVGPVPLVAGRLDGELPVVSGSKPAMARAGSCSAKSSAKDGTAMPTRIRIGTTVQSTSISVLWRGLRRHRVGARVEAHHAVDEQRQDEQRDQRHDDQHAVVEAVDHLHDRRRRRLKVDLPRLRASARAGLPPNAATARAGQQPAPSPLASVDVPTNPLLLDPPGAALRRLSYQPGLPAEQRQVPLSRRVPAVSPWNRAREKP